MENFIGFICHFQNDEVINRLNIIKSALPSNYTLYFISPTHCENTYNVDNFISLDITIEEFKKEMISVVTRNELAYNAVYKMHPNYDYYWFIEFDVIFGHTNTSEKWNTFFNEFHTTDYDLIITHYNLYNHLYKLGPYRLYKMQFQNSDDGIIKKNNILQQDNIRFGFYPICRLSNKLLSMSCEYFTNNPTNFFEYALTSLANFNNLSIFDLDTTRYSQVIETTESNIHKCINCGSISWFIEDKTIYDDNVLIHPVKC